MKNLILLTIFFLLCAIHCINAQLLAFPSQDDKEMAAMAIEVLPKSVLLVRLKNTDRKIAALQKAGYEKKAARLKKETAVFNQDLMDAFQEVFDICPVYFFKMGDTELVLKRQFDKVSFLGESPEIPDDQYIFIATWGNLHLEGEPAASHFIGIRLRVAEQGHLLHIPKPFPFQMNHGGNLLNPNSTALEATVSRHQWELKRFYNKTMKKKRKKKRK